MNINELYKKINNKVDGKVLCENDEIIWRLPNDIEFVIDICGNEGYVEVNYKDYCITHWHPLSDEIYDDLIYMNNNYYWVRKKKIFGYGRPMFIEKDKYNSFSKKKKSKYTII